MPPKTLGIMPTFLRTEQDAIYTTSAIATFMESCDAELVIIDDGSPNQSLVEEMHESLPARARVVFKEANEGFARTVNIGLREARTRGLNALLVNADIEFIEPGWLERMETRPEAVVGGLLLYPNGLIQHAGVFFSVITRTYDHIYRLAPGSLAAAHHERICPVTGALQLIKHECLVNVGIYDENYRLTYEDVDYCHEVFDSGRLCVYDPNVRAIHHESVFRRNETEQIHRWRSQSWAYFLEKHKGLDFSENIPTLIPELDEVS